MWPYNEDEAGWLNPQKRVEPPRHVSANDNESGRRVPPRGPSEPTAKVPKS
jgi:hypothetical protein